MRIGHINRLHSGCGWIVSWPEHAPGWEASGRRRAVEQADSFFFAARDAYDFDSLYERDRVSFEPVEPVPAKGPRARYVLKVDDGDDD